MEELKNLSTEGDLLIDDLYEQADELDNIDDLAWYFITNGQGAWIVGGY